MRDVPEALYLAMGFPAYSGFGVRADIVERVALAMRGVQPASLTELARWLSLSSRDAQRVVAAIDT
jgi:hypothetical protein